MPLRLASLGVGVILGFVFDWARLTDPDTFHDMLTLASPDVFLLMGSAVAVAAAGVHLLRGRRALLTGEPIGIETPPVQRAHVVGGLIFGTGWAIASSCPGPLVAQLGAGRALALATSAGVVCGVLAQVQIARRAAREVPAAHALEVL